MGLVVYGPKSDADIAAPAPILLHTVQRAGGKKKEEEEKKAVPPV